MGTLKGPKNGGKRVTQNCFRIEQSSQLMTGWCVSFYDLIAYKLRLHQTQKVSQRDLEERKVEN